MSFLKGEVVAVDNAVEKAVGLWIGLWISADPVMLGGADQPVLQLAGVPPAHR